MEEEVENLEPSSKRPKLEEYEAITPDQTDDACINRLPYEILCKIFRKLHFQERNTCSQVCKRWFVILRSEPFIDSVRFHFSTCFGLPLQMCPQAYMDSCVHCVVHDCGAFPEVKSQQEILSMVRTVQCAADEPGPSTRVTGGKTVEQFLFSGELPLKTLEIRSSFDRMRRYLGDRLMELKTLQQLKLTVLPDSIEDLPAEKAPHWVITHPTLPSLIWELYANTNGYAVILPSLERYRLEIANDYDLNTLINIGSQLVELIVWFYFDRGFEQTLTVPFPKLKKLLLKRFGEKNNSPDPNTRVDDLSAERFVQNAPLLEDIYLISNTVTFRLFRAICLFAADRLTRLTVRDVIFPREMFLLIRELKNLQFLRLKDCILEEGSRLRGLDFPRLQHLELINSGTCFRLDATFAHIQRFKYSMDSQLSRLCRHMVMLEDLEIKLNIKVPVAENIREHFHSLATLKSLRTLRICGMETYTRPWAFCEPMPAIKHLVLRNCHLLRCNFKQLRVLFPRLKVLELNKTCIVYKRLPDGVKPLLHLQRRLKQYFPNCCVTVNPSSSVKPISTALLMEDKYQWNLEEIKRRDMKEIPLRGKN
ncbi:uncharacterized protein LOC126568051 [Anopheles maculipalpis]|uniref:uncharacterized protein LOC126568051 n=1 Tax=Anopheles maculipalpis TaxID=1496333 RepID=UPI002158C0FE|nr:uncharacterized protein LOC126568051 [Anopheles maculipalpis]